MRLRLAFACLAFAVCGALAAGCAQPAGSPRQETSAVAQQPTSAPPTVTAADPGQRAMLEANEAYYAGQTATAIAGNEIATRVALDRAQAEATKSALALTQQVETFNQQSTQQAVSVAATAAQIALDQQRAAVTMTSQAIAAADVRATTQAEDLALRRREHEERSRQREQAALEWQTGYVVKLALSVLAVIAGAVLIYHLARLLAFAIPIFIRRLLVLTRERMVFDPATERWMLLPDYPTLPPSAPAASSDRLAAVVQRAVARGHAVSGDVAQARAARLAWKNAAWSFLRLGEALGTLSRRPMMAAGMSEGDWRTLTAFLAAMGFLVQPKPSAPYTLALRADGRPLTARDVMRATRCG